MLDKLVGNPFGFRGIRFRTLIEAAASDLVGSWGTNCGIVPTALRISLDSMHNTIEGLFKTTPRISLDPERVNNWRKSPKQHSDLIGFRGTKSLKKNSKIKSRNNKTSLMSHHKMKFLKSASNLLQNKKRCHHLKASITKVKISSNNYSNPRYCRINLTILQMISTCK